MNRAIWAGVVVSLLWWPVVGRAGLVVDQPPFPAGGPAADTAFRNFFDQPRFQQVADNILLDNSATVRQVTWWGFYGAEGQSHNPPPGDETFRLRFYGARPGDGLPDDGNVIFEESFVAPLRTATGQIVDADVTAPEFVYQTNLSGDVFLQADTPYWLEIVQVGDFGSTFRWENGFGLLLGHATINTSLPFWHRIDSGSFAFQLSTIPEPQTFLLLTTGMILFLMRRNKRHGDLQQRRGMMAHPHLR
jgi:hypothetical protein